MNWKKDQYKKESVLVIEKIENKVMKNKKTILKEEILKKEKKEERREKKENLVDVIKIDNVMVHF